MPHDVETAVVETETGFGTGLRTHLERLRPGAPGPGEPSVEPEPFEAAEVAAEPLSETEALRAELAEALDREEALRSSLADQVGAYERKLDHDTDLTRRIAELEERERRVADQLEWIQAETWRLTQTRADVEAQRGARRAPDQAPEPAQQQPEEQLEPTEESARALLRRRKEEQGERIWAALEGALDATRPDGTPDFPTRLAAATALLGEGYGEVQRPVVAEAGGEAAAAASDELAGLRARKAQLVGEPQL
jgi:hypothetical protein